MVGPQNNPNDATTTSSLPTSGRGLVHDESLMGYPTEPALMPRGYSYVCWGAVVAGSLAAISLLILAGALGSAIGLSAYGRDGVYRPGWGAGIWLVLSAAVAYFIGGGLSAYLASYRTGTIGLLHGVMAWVLSLPLLLLVAGPIAGGLLGRAGMPTFTAADTGRMGGAFAGQPEEMAIGAAWTSFIALFSGLLTAAIGGGAVAFSTLLTNLGNRSTTR